MPITPSKIWPHPIISISRNLKKQSPLRFGTQRTSPQNTADRLVCLPHNSRVSSTVSACSCSLLQLLDNTAGEHPNTTASLASGIMASSYNIPLYCRHLHCVDGSLKHQRRRKTEGIRSTCCKKHRNNNRTNSPEARIPVPYPCHQGVCAMQVARCSGPP